MRFAAAEDYLKTLQGENAKLTLAVIGRIVDRLPRAVRAAKYIQVAGTNGKGSTAHFIASILRSHGWRVGLFTSPHLQDVRERIRFNGRLISKSDFVSVIGAMARLAGKLLRQGFISGLPTFFETLFLAALIYFQRQKADWVVLEVGLGGRLDATSTIQPELSIITGIARDHTHILGKTLAAIAREKAGIARENVPLVSGCPPRSVAGRTIARVALGRRAPLHEVFAEPRALQVEKTGRSYRCLYRSNERLYAFRVYLHGRHQTVNAAVAVKAMDVLRQRGFPIEPAAMARGIRNMFIPARLEFLPGRPPLLLDGGHNPDGIRVLVDFLREENIRNFTLIFGVLADKHYPAMARQLAPLAANVILTAPHSARALPPEKLLPFFKHKNCRIEMNVSRALAIAKKLKTVIIVCGSLYLVGAMRTEACGGEKYGRQEAKGN